jgi:hypothetical protein
LIEVSEDPGDPTDCIDGCDLRDVVPLVAMDIGVEAAGVRRKPPLPDEIVAGWVVAKAGLVNFLDPPE